MTDQTDPRIDAAVKAKFMAETNGACDGFPNPCEQCDCFYEAQWAEHERDVMRQILAAADAVEPIEWQYGVKFTTSIDPDRIVLGHPSGFLPEIVESKWRRRVRRGEWEPFGD